MVRKSYHFLWWLLMLVIAAGVIWYIGGLHKNKEYKNGTLVRMGQDVVQALEQTMEHIAVYEVKDGKDPYVQAFVW